MNLLDRAREILASEPGIGRYKLAQRLGIGERAARDLINQIKRGDAPESGQRQERHSFEYKDDGSCRIELDGTLISSEEELFRQCKIDREVWAVRNLKITAWGVGMKPPSFTEVFDTSAGTKWPAWQRDKKNTKPITVQLFSVRADLVPKREVIAAKNEIEALRKKAEGYAPKYPAIIVRDLKKSGTLVEYALHDHHFGAHIWGRETGGADYDLKAAKDCWEPAITQLVARTRDFRPDRALLILGNDQQNADNRAGTTERGTAQSMDTRYQKVFGVSRDCSIWAIESLLSVVPAVEVVIVPGNHDPLSAWHLGDSLAAWFRNCQAVRVNNEPTQRKYVEHGVNMLMYTHGNAGKLEEYGKTMAAEQPAMWGRTLWREAHTGDKHHRRLIEFQGYAVRILPSLRPPCAWSAENHYIGAVRAAEAYAFNDREGLIGSAVYSILDAPEVSDAHPTKPLAIRGRARSGDRHTRLAPSGEAA